MRQLRAYTKRVPDQTCAMSCSFCSVESPHRTSVFCGSPSSTPRPCGLHHGDRDQDQRLPRHRQDRERPTKYDGDQCVRPLYLCAIITGIHTSECWHYGGPNTFMYSYSAFVFIHRCLSASRDNFRYAFTDCLQTHCNTEVSFRHAQAYFITD